MAVVSFKGIDVVVAEGAVRLYKAGDLVYAAGYDNEITGMGPTEQEDFLLRKGIPLAEAYLAGELDLSLDLEPWE
jgi:hypothetical protein